MPRYDPTAINVTVNLVELAGADTHLRRVSGEEHAGPCPKCGGRDRFHVTASWWFCRQCHEKRADAIEYLRWRDGASFTEACEALGGAPTAPRMQNTRRAAPTLAAIPDTAPPGEAWQERARALVAHCAALLWENPTALSYLHSRGLRDEAIRAAGLGWCPGGWRDDPARWGLDPAKYPNGVRPARGWVIPCEMGGVLWYVKVRRDPAELAAIEARTGEKPDKYLCVSGSHKAGAVYGLGGVGRATVDVILVEGEFNALVLGQELAGVGAVVSVGDAGNKPCRAAMNVLGRVPRPWAVYDGDDAGQRGAAALGALWGRVRRLSWPWGTRGDKYDVNAAHLDGENLAAWALPQLGPPDPAKRRTWLEHWLNALDDAAFAAGTDTTIPALRAWLVLWEQWRALQAASSPPPQAPAPIVEASTASTWWPGDGWQEAPAPDWAPPEVPGLPRRWATNAAGQWKSLT